jgi:hypothetical protein
LEHIEEGGIPARFLPLQEAIICQWQWGELNEQNRFSPEIEQNLTMSPTNWNAC